MNGKQTLKVIIAALLGTGMVSAPAAFAQEMPDFEEWACKFCPFPEKGVSGDAGASALHVSDDSARFGDYTGLDEDGLYPNAEADVLYRAGDGYAVSLYARDVGLDSRDIELSVGRQGSWVVDLSWDELPRRLDDTVQTAYTGLGSDRLTLPASWVRANTTGGMTALDDTLRDFTLGWDRKTGGLGVEFVQSGKLRYEADWTRETKEGRGLTWGNFLGTAADLAKPLDYQTDQVDAAVIYSGSGWTIQLGYYGSFFSNRDTSLTWDNPFTGPDQGRSAMAPDNRYHQGRIAGVYRFDTWDTTLNASYAMGRMEQTDALLQYTINPALVSQPLPVNEFDGEADTTAANLRLSARPADRLRLTAEYRYNERDNKSGQYDWTPVQADSFPGATSRNPVYSFEDRDLAFTADYRFRPALRGAVGWKQQVRERDFQNVDRNDEDTYWGRIRYRPMSKLALTFYGETASRDASTYQALPSIGAGAAQNPLLRKYYLADRDRDLFRVEADFTPVSRFTLSVRYEDARDRYDDSEVGLVAADYDQLSADASLQLWKSLVATAYYSRDNYDSTTIGAASFATPNLAPPNWRGRSRDRHDVHGIALAWPGVAEGKLDLRADWTQADTTGDISVTSPLAGDPSPFPTIESDWTGAELRADWHFNPRWSLNLGYRYESYDADDWAKDGVGPATIENVLTFGAETQDYDVHVFLVGFKYRFVKEAEE